MLDSKFFITLIGLIVAVFAICNTNMSPSVNEGFFGGSFTRKSVKDVYCKKGDSMFVSHPNLKDNLSPCMNGTGSLIRYNQPDYKQPYVTLNALGDMANANYQDIGSCGEPLGQESNSQAISNKAKNVVSDCSLPIGDMTTLNSDCDNKIIYERNIYSKKRSKLSQYGDPIRGDIFIPPRPKSGWFDVSVDPKYDLKKGALSVIGDICDKQPNCFYDLNSDNKNITFG